MKGNFSIVASAILLFANPSFAVQGEEAVVIREEEPSKGRILLAPFSVPPLLVRAASYPLVRFADFAERVDLANRTVDFFSNDTRTAFWFPTLRFGGKGGFFFGLGASHRDFPRKGWGSSLLAQITPELDQEMSASVGSSLVGISLNWKRRQDDSFFGIGNDRPDRPLNYDGRKLVVEVPVGENVTDFFRWEIFGRYVHLDTSDTEDLRFSVAANLPPGETPGLAERIDGGECGARVTFDSRTPRGTPGSGTTAGVSFSRFEGSGPNDFFRTEVRLSRFFTLFLPGRVLAVGARWEFISTPGGGSVPFPLLPSMGGSSNLRGFEGGRFRDRSSLLLVGEYRYPVFQWMDGLLFLEGGRVGNDPVSLSPSGLHLSYGGGLRFRTADRFFFQLQGAGSSDGARFVFSMNQSL